MQDTESERWTFGQVLPLVSLIAPLTIMFEELLSYTQISTLTNRSPEAPESNIGCTPSEPESTSGSVSQVHSAAQHSLALPLHSVVHRNTSDADDADYDLYNSSWIQSYLLILFIILSVETTNVLAIAAARYGVPSLYLLPFGSRHFNLASAPFSHAVFLFLTILYSLFFDQYLKGPKIQFRIVYCGRLGLYTTVVGFVIIFVIRAYSRVGIGDRMIVRIISWLPVAYAPLYGLLGILDAFWANRWSN